MNSGCPEAVATSTSSSPDPTDATPGTAETAPSTRPLLRHRSQRKAPVAGSSACRLPLQRAPLMVVPTAARGQGRHAIYFCSSAQPLASSSALKTCAHSPAPRIHSTALAHRRTSPVTRKGDRGCDWVIKLPRRGCFLNRPVPPAYLLSTGAPLSPRHLFQEAGEGRKMYRLKDKEVKKST